VDTEVDGGALTGFDNLVVQLLLHLGHHFLDTGGMDTAVGHQLVERQTADLTTHRIEGRDNDALGRIVDHNLNAAGSFQGADVASLATDDAAFSPHRCRYGRR
jgi:hypothetical protein